METTEITIGLEPKEPIEVTEVEITTEAIERPKLVPLEESPRSPSPEFVEAVVEVTEVPVPEEEQPEVEEEVLEQAPTLAGGGLFNLRINRHHRATIRN